VVQSRGTLAWMLGAFLVTFVLTRVVTRMIRADRGPFSNAKVGSVHVHHDVYGIFLMLCAGAGEFIYRPPPPWLQVLAVAFACGAALTLDELALWLYMKDVYWAQEGRTSVDAVLVAACIGGLLLLGANPLSDEAEAGTGIWAATTTLVGNLVFSFGAIRLGKPHSPWARKWYHAGSRQLARSQERFPPDERTWWESVKDKIGGFTQT
jgi:hypothetical protein